MKLFAISIMIFTMVLLYSPVYSQGYGSGTPTTIELLDEWYAEVCPFGTAIITDLSKNKIGEAACVNYDYKTRSWITWEGDVDRKKNFRNWDSSNTRVWTMDGELKLSKGHPIVEQYGAMTIDDKRFPEWIKTH